MDLKTYVRIFKRRKWIVVTVAFLSSSVYFARLLALPPNYQATSVIILRPPTFENQMFAYLMQTPLSAAREIDLQTQIQLMNTLSMAETVARKVRQAGLRLTPDEIFSMKSVEQISGTPSIAITVTAQSAKKAREVANAYARAAVEENHKLARRSFESAVSYVKEKLAHNDQRLKEVEAELSRFQRQHGIVSFPDELKQQIEFMTSQRAQLQQAVMDMEAVSGQIRQIRSRLAAVAPEAVERRRIPNPELESYRAQIRPLESRLLELSRGYTEEHPKVQAVKEQISRLRGEVRTEVARSVEVEDIVANPEHVRLQDELITAELDRERLRVRAELLGQTHLRQRERLRELSALDSRYFELDEEIESVRKQRQKLGELLEELQVSTLMQEGSAEILEPARPAAVSRLQNRGASLLVMIISLILGVGAGVLLEVLDDRVRTPAHARRHLNLPALGSIPRVEKNGQMVLAGQSPKSVVADPFHRLGFNLQQAAKKSDAKVIAITSTKPKEGKTTICANLAVSLSWGGSQICLVDADLRHPGLHHIFSRSNAIGLSSVLGGEIEAEGRLKAIQEGRSFEPESFREAVRHAVVETSEGLCLLPAGPPVPNPVRLFRSQMMRQLLEELRQDYDYVFVDTPPVLSVSDAQILSARCDGILLVVDAQTTKKNEVAYVISQLKTTERLVFGVVLNFVDPADDTYYYYYHEARVLRR